MALRINKQTRGALAVFCAVSAILPGVAFAAPQNAATAETEFFGSEPWPAQRVVVLMPLQLGPSWNLDKTKSTPLLHEAEAELQRALQRTGKFSTTQLHRYNPIILRSVQEKLLTKEQADALLAAPTLDGVQKALAPMRFDQAPLIAQVTLDEAIVAAGSPTATVSTKATGRLYEANNPQPIREVVVSSVPEPLYKVQKRRGNTVLVQQSPRTRILKAAEDSFNQIARDFVRPIEDITLPDAVLPAPVTGTVVVPAPALIEVPAGQVLGTFQIPKK